MTSSISTEFLNWSIWQIDVTLTGSTKVDQVVMAMKVYSTFLRTPLNAV